MRIVLKIVDVKSFVKGHGHALKFSVLRAV